MPHSPCLPSPLCPSVELKQELRDVTSHAEEEGKRLRKERTLLQHETDDMRNEVGPFLSCLGHFFFGLGYLKAVVACFIEERWGLLVIKVLAPDTHPPLPSRHCCLPPNPPPPSLPVAGRVAVPPLLAAAIGSRPPRPYRRTARHDRRNARHTGHTGDAACGH